LDNLTHSLVGALLGQLGLKRKTALAMPTLIIAANIPDIDAVAVLLGGNEHLAIRRGITHGPIALVVLPILLWAAMLAWARWRPNPNRAAVHSGWLLALAYIGTISHPALDWLNSYGIRLLKPFSSAWFAGDTIFIVDVWIWAALALSVWLSLRSERAGKGGASRPAWLGFAAISAYIAGNGLITGHAESATKGLVVVRDDRVATSTDPVVVANPVPFFFWRRELLWRDAVHYGDGAYTLGSPPDLSTEAQPHNMSDPRIAAFSAKDESARAFLFWSRMPIAKFQTKDGIETMTIQDQRFAHPLARDRFMVRLRRDLE
jgi:inner membrane protein